MSPALERLLSAVEGVTGHPRERSGRGFKLFCPLHDGHSAALAISEAANGRILIHCHAGCDTGDILRTVGMEWRDFYGDGARSPQTARQEASGATKAEPPVQSPSPQSLAEFCKQRRLDPERLASRWQVRETAFMGRPCLRYPTALAIDRLKFLDGAKPKYRWTGRGGHAHLYGLRAARQHGGPVLFLANGEPSVWACDQARVPAVCLCGEKVTFTLDMIEALGTSGFERFKIVYDRDAAGRDGARKAVKVLRDAGLEAQALELPPDLGTGGDVDDLHRRVGDDGLLAALEGLPPLPEPVGAGPVLRPFSAIEPEEVSWLWEPYVPSGKLVLFQGDPGVGKTSAALELCARLTRHGDTAIYASLEDGWGDTLRPRAEKAGADLDRLVALTGRREEDGSERPMTLDDWVDLEKAVLEVKPALLVLDPISAWIQHADMHKANEVRGKLAPMVSLAEKHGVTVLILQHLTKAKTDRAIYRGLGSIDFVAACRSALLFGVTAAGQRAAVHLKNSLGPLGKSIGYTIGEEGFSWTGENGFTAADLLEAEAGPEEAAEREDAAAWLQAALSEGPQEAADLQQRFEREQRGTRRTLRRALASIGGIRTREGFGRGGRIIWSLPTIGDTSGPIGDTHTHRVPYDETTAPKGLQGKASTIGDKEKECVPYEGQRVPYGEGRGPYVEV
jgi:KaiC/GvpD/RAD55 family RecA-like ATPase